MITAILARSDNGIIGIEGRDGPTLPWRLSPDLKRFRELTTGHAIILGRKTFDSIGRTLPNRENFIVSRQSPGSWKTQDLTGDWVWARTPEQALKMALARDPDPFIIGGASIYAALWPRVERVELTEVHTIVGLGVAMGFDLAKWRETARSEEQEHEGLRFHFVTLQRVAAEEGPRT